MSTVPKKHSHLTCVEMKLRNSHQRPSNLQSNIHCTLNELYFSFIGSLMRLISQISSSMWHSYAKFVSLLINLFLQGTKECQRLMSWEFTQIKFKDFLYQKYFNDKVHDRTNSCHLQRYKFHRSLRRSMKEMHSQFHMKFNSMVH